MQRKVLDKMIVVQPIKNFPVFFRVQMFQTCSHEAATKPEPVSITPSFLKFQVNIILHLCLVFQSGLFPLGIPTKIFKARATWPAHLIAFVTCDLLHSR